MAAAAKRLTLIMDLIDLTQRDVSSCDATRYHADRRLRDATALRVMHIGENAARLDPAVKARYPGLPWRNMAGLRNVVAHDYAGINHGLIRRTVIEYLDEVRVVCTAELAALDEQGE